MPDQPVEGAPTPEEDPAAKLRARLDRIEQEEAGSLSPTSEDEVPSRSIKSPIESQIDDYTEGAEEHQQDPELTLEERKLQEFDERLKAARSGAMPDPPEWNYQRPKIPGQNEQKDAVAYVGLGVGISVGYTMIGAVILGWGVGKLIDMKTGGMVGQGIGTLLGAIIGLAGGVFMIIRAQGKNPKS